MYRKNQVLGRFCPAQHPDSRFILFCNCLIFSIMQSENSLKLCSPLRKFGRIRLKFCLKSLEITRKCLTLHQPNNQPNGKVQRKTADYLAGFQ